MGRILKARYAVLGSIAWWIGKRVLKRKFTASRRPTGRARAIWPRGH
jgi:hypothetical protein